MLQETLVLFIVLLSSLDIELYILNINGKKLVFCFFCYAIAQLAFKLSN